MTDNAALHWPEAATAGWMVVAGVLATVACASFYIYHGWPEWRIRYLQWRGLEVTAFDIAATQGYRPRAPESVPNTVLHSLSMGTAAAVWVWSRDYSGLQADAIVKLAEAVPLILVLLWALRKPRGEVGAPPVEEPKARHSWWTVAALLCVAAIAFFSPLPALQAMVGFDLVPALVLAALVVGGVAMLHKARRERADGFEEGAIEARNNAVLCFSFAVVVLFFWGLAHVDLS
ncbi:MAG: hypothetical protein J7496_06275 [Novosphingobium sp.]|nr:hypothetical protein [Novosphingobium sp.]